MRDGFADAFLGRCLQVCLIDCVANDEHIINTDSNQQERHQVVHSGSLSTKEEAEAEAGSVRQADTQKSHEGGD